LSLVKIPSSLIFLAAPSPDRPIPIVARTAAFHLSASGAAVTTDLDATEAVVNLPQVFEEIDLGADVTADADVAGNVHAFMRAGADNDDV
jgi:hypothetical protein